jgi:hypothetical protein
MSGAHEIHVVWWALVAGGFLGGLSKLLVDGRFVFPSMAYLETTNERIFVPGFVADLLLGPVAAFVVAGAGAATFDFQSEFNQRGFWGPFIGSIPAGLGASYFLAQATKARLDKAEERLLGRAKEAEARGVGPDA